jgi:hypothetical protein
MGCIQFLAECIFKDSKVPSKQKIVLLREELSSAHLLPRPIASRENFAKEIASAAKLLQ